MAGLLASPTWVSDAVVQAIYSQIMRDHGGRIGPSKPGALEAALTQPQNLLAYSEVSQHLSIPKLAAAYGVALARGHCFPDGNKRIALAVMDTFLQLNGFEMTAPDGPAVVAVMRSVAAGEMIETELAAWVEKNHHPL